MKEPPGDRASSLPPLLGALLRMPVDAIRRRMRDDLHRAGFDDIIPEHFSIVRYPGPEGRHPSELADEAGVSRQAMNYLLSDLEAKGYLIRRPDPDDGRAKLVFLTDRGRAVQRTVRATIGRLEEELSSQLGADDFARLRELLVRLNTCEFAGGVPTPRR